MDLERFDRQILLFGRDGQEKIAAARVTIVGLGGTGSHVAQQLAYLGVRKYGLVDADRVTQSSLNRLIGATRDDVEKSVPKVDVAARTIRAIEPSAEIATVPDSFVSEAGSAAPREPVYPRLRGPRRARLLLNEFACSFNKPYLDLATDTHPDNQGLSFGGQLMVRSGGNGCLYCLDLLDPQNIHRDLTFPERREEEDAMYGVRREVLGQRSPSVVSLNGILASVAVMEFLLLVTGTVRQPKRLLRYDGMRGILIESKDEPRVDCPYCSQPGKGVSVDWHRHVRAGLGRWVR